MVENVRARPRIFGVDVDNFDISEAVEAVTSLVETDRAHSVVTVNLDHVLKLKNDQSFREAYAAASICVADGTPFIWMSCIDGSPLKERVAGSDIIDPLCANAAEKGLSVFLLGTTDDRLQRASNSLIAKHPKLTIAGTHAPPMGFDKNEEAQAEAFNLLRKARPDIVLVALGAPKQEKFSARAVAELDHGVFMNIGAGLDFIAGDVERAPVWMQRSGTEWLHRAFGQPARLAPRYLKIVTALPGMVKDHYNSKKSKAA